MGNYEQLKQAVSEVIKTNGKQEITGEILQNALLTIISTVGANSTFAGIATPETNPGTPDQNVFYIASENGIYSNFGGVTLMDEVAIFSNTNGSWVKSDTGIATKVKMDKIDIIANDIVKAISIISPDYTHYFNTSLKLYVKREMSSTFSCFIIPIKTGDVFCLGVRPGAVGTILGLSERPIITSGSSVDITNIIQDFEYILEQLGDKWYLTVQDAKSALYIGFTYSDENIDGKDYCVKIGSAFLTEKDIEQYKTNEENVKAFLGASYSVVGNYFDIGNKTYCNPKDGVFTFESIIVPIEEGGYIYTGAQTMVNYVFLSDRPNDILPKSGCHDIADIIVDVQGSLEKRKGLNGWLYRMPDNIENAKYLGITINSNIASNNKYAISLPSSANIMTDFDRTSLYMQNLRAISDSVKSNTLMEFIPAYFDLNPRTYPNGYMGIESNLYKCIIVPARNGDVIRIPITEGLINPCVLSSFPDFPGILDEGVILSKNNSFNIVEGYSEFNITDADARYFSVSFVKDAVLPTQPILIDSGNARYKDISDVKKTVTDVNAKIPIINQDLGFVKDFDLGKYDDLLLIMDGQSLSIGWESVAISTDPKENCYMIGTDPCTLYRKGFNGIGFNPLKSVTRESPNVSWCNVLSRLIPNKRMITESVGEGAKKIASLSKTDGSEILEAEYMGDGKICDPTNGVITNGSLPWRTWLLEVEEGVKYFIADNRIITKFSAKPNVGSNTSIYVGNGNADVVNSVFTCPAGVTYLAITTNTENYVGDKFFVIKGEAGRYEKGFLLPIYQTANISHNEKRLIGCPAIMWMQGESDADGGTTKEDYKTMLVKLKNDMQNDIKTALNQNENVLFFCYIPAMAYIKENHIAQAIIECCEENDDMIIVAPIYAMPDYNNLHLASNGNRWYGEYIARATYNALIMGKRNNCVTIDQIKKSTNEVVIKVNAPQLPLVVDTWTVQEIPDYGFSVWKDGIKCTITNIDIFADVITLTTQENIDSGVIEVSYAGYNTDNVSLYRGAGNIRDSSRWQAMQDYWDDRDDNGTDGTSTITYRPKDKDGSSIIGKKYPMQNWLQNFYHKFE